MRPPRTPVHSNPVPSPPPKAALFPNGAALPSPSPLKARRPQLESRKSAGRRPDPSRPHLVEMGHAGRGRSRRRAPCASCLLGRRSDPIRRGGSLRLRQRGRRPAAREVDAFVSVSRCRSSSRSSAPCWITGSRPFLFSSLFLPDYTRRAGPVFFFDGEPAWHSTIDFSNSRAPTFFYPAVIFLPAGHWAGGP